MLARNWRFEETFEANAEVPLDGIAVEQVVPGELRDERRVQYDSPDGAPGAHEFLIDPRAS
jgi:hypothetical protein